MTEAAFDLETARFSAAISHFDQASLVSKPAIRDFVAVSCLGISSLYVREQVVLRSQKMAEKNWAEADRIRDELLDKGIQLKDGKNPATGERTTTWEVKR